MIIYIYIYIYIYIKYLKVRQLNIIKIITKTTKKASKRYQSLSKKEKEKATIWL